MKAICFTFDRNMPVMEYVLYTYFKHWPDNPFVFYVPWNKIKPNHLVDKYGADKIKLLQTDSAVKPTIRTLLSVIEPDEFVWWAQDDKYILDFKNKQIIKELYQFNAPNIGGFMFTKNADAHKSHLKGTTSIGGHNLIKKKNHHQIFQPQLLKKEVIEYLYLNERLEEHYPLSKLYPIMNFRPVKDLYATSSNQINIAESLDAGKMTKNLVYNMRKDGFKIPKLPECKKTIIYKD
jgi:hypothetical protein